MKKENDFKKWFENQNGFVKNKPTINVLPGYEKTGKSNFIPDLIIKLKTEK